MSAARAIDYVGAGTVEFIVDGDVGLNASAFYFMEMNTRLQVEHPVTELITGLDLVEWQLNIAAGDPLPLTQDEVVLTGHAIEARIYAENPAKKFLPSPGNLSHLRLPDQGSHIRVDAGVAAGDSITPHYDPLIAKLIVWDEDRARAVRRLSGALTEIHVIGLVTNRDFLLGISNHHAFRDAALDTGFIDRHLAELIPEVGPVGDRTLALAALAVLADRRATALRDRAPVGDPYSPWGPRGPGDGWQLNAPASDEVVFVDPGRDEDGGRIPIPLRQSADRDFTYEFDLPDGSMLVTGELEDGGRLLANLDGTRISVSVYRTGDEFWVVDDAGRTHRLFIEDPSTAVAAVEVVDMNVTAPLPGTISDVLIEVGEKVGKGAGLVVIEAMKMEHTIVAPADGTIATIHFVVTDLVEEGAILLEFES